MQWNVSISAADEDEEFLADLSKKEDEDKTRYEGNTLFLVCSNSR